MANTYTASSKVASWALDLIDEIFRYLEIPKNDDLEEFVYATIVILIAWGIGWVVKTTLLFVIKKIPKLRDSASMAAKQGQRIFIEGSKLIPPIVFVLLIPFAFTSDARMLKIILAVSWVYILYRFVCATNTILDYVWHRYDERDNEKNHPLKGLLQISKGLVWLIGLILIGSIVLGKSPVALLTGLGAFAAILMLIFKDSILGLVSGVQLSQNDMLRVGDWIVVPGTPANGIVIDVSLTVVKVQNWDNTTAMLPPYTLVSTSFQNWRGMQDSGVRRIVREYSIDVDSVQFSTSEMLEDFKKIPFMNDYITIKQKQAAEGATCNVSNPENIVNGTIETNLGLLRAYMTMYLKNNANISQTSTLMVRSLDPTPNGIPLQLYCFTNTTDWVAYEAIQAEIYEHFASILPRFGLYVFENPSGRDTVNQGFLEGGMNPNQVYGLPYQSVYNWDPGENKYPDAQFYKHWSTPPPQNRSYDVPPRNASPQSDEKGTTTTSTTPKKPQ